MTTQPKLFAPSPSGLRAPAPPPATLAETTLAQAAVRTLDIGLDVDGVIYDFVNALRLYIHHKTGRPLHTMPTPTTWNFYADDWGLSLEEFLAFFDAGVNDGFIFAVGDPFPGVVAGIDRLLSAGHRIHVITDRGRNGRPGMGEQLTRTYFEQHHIRYTSLTVTHDKTAVRTDAFLEDRPENYTALVGAGVDCYIRSHAYNEHVEVPSGRRLPGFTEFVDAILAA